MSDPMVIKVNFSLGGELEIKDFGDDYVSFRNQDEMKRYHKKMAIKFIERLIDQKGVEHFDLQMVTKARDMVESDFPPVKETVGDNEPPF